MWTINLALGYVSAFLCLATGLILHSSIFVASSIGLALIVFVLNKVLERRGVHQLYYQNLRHFQTESWD
jgi:hypothetical protein